MLDPPPARATILPALWSLALPAAAAAVAVRDAADGGRGISDAGSSVCWPIPGMRTPPAGRIPAAEGPSLNIAIRARMLGDTERLRGVPAPWNGRA